MLINNTMTAPIQKPEKLPDTIPDNIVSEAPPSFDAVQLHVCVLLWVK